VKRRRAVNEISRKLEAPERRVCRVLGQPRSTQRYLPRTAEDETGLVQRTIELASAFGRFGYRQVAHLPRREGWLVGKNRVERIWCEEGLKVPQKQPKRKRLWLNDGSCMRRRAEHKDHVLY